MLPELSPEEVHRRLQAGEIIVVDIREPAEIAEKSIEGSVLAPLAVVDRQKLQSETAPREVVFFCQSGRRTSNFSAHLEAVPHAKYQMQGGLNAWEKAGLPLRRGKTLPLPMNRQIQIAAGSLVLFGTVGSFFWSPLLWLGIFVGAGLVFAGASGFCGMALLLARMPWNKI